MLYWLLIQSLGYLPYITVLISTCSTCHFGTWRTTLSCVQLPTLSPTRRLPVSQMGPQDPPTTQALIWHGFSSLMPVERSKDSCNYTTAHVVDVTTMSNFVLLNFWSTQTLFASFTLPLSFSYYSLQTSCYNNWKKLWDCGGWIASELSRLSPSCSPLQVYWCKTRGWGLGIKHLRRAPHIWV